MLSWVELLGCWEGHDAFLQQKPENVRHDFSDNPMLSCRYHAYLVRRGEWMWCF